MRNRLAERLEGVADGLGPIGSALLWPMFEIVVLLGLLLAPIWFLVTLFIGPGRPPPPGRSPRD